MAFGERLQRLLQVNELKQADLARHLHVTRATVSRYCQGRLPDGSTLQQMADYLGVSVDYLLDQQSDRHGDPVEELVSYLRNADLTADDIDAIRDLIAARRLRRKKR